jgi:hypothetical protein
MSTMRTISTIAKYEAKTLARGWFFRIFAALAIAFVVFFDLFGILGLGDGGWPGRILPGSVPYMNLFVLNLAQAVIAVFLSSDFLGRDKKLDTTEAFYVRSMSNMAYVVGKMVGILHVFVMLNLLVMVIGAVFNLIAADVAFIPITYLLYPLLISLPTLLFILGLSFGMMVLLRNQAVVFLLMLGLIGASLFFLNGKLYNVFDLAGFNTPFLYSEFTGLANAPSVFLLRAAYGLLGLGFVFMTILLLPRLPQERAFKSKMILGMVLTIAPALAMLGLYVSDFHSGKVLRETMVAQELALPADPSLCIENLAVDLEHQNSKIAVTAKLEAVVLNNGDLVLALNPAFSVSRLTVNGIAAAFERKNHLLTISHSGAAKGERLVIELDYSGAPSNEATFIEIPEAVRGELNRLDPLVAGKQVAFVTSDYLLLTREAMWYPVAGHRQFRTQPQFVKSHLRVKTNEGLQVLSQGKKEVSADGWTLFEPLQPLNALSLLAGRYDVKTVMVDSVAVSLWMHSGNKMVGAYFDLIVDTVPALISDMKREYERKLGIDYPFGRFDLVEVPIHFYTYPRSWTLATDDNMPGMVLLAEKGAGGFQSDFNRQKRRIERDNERNNQGLLPKEIQVRLFNNLIGSLLFNPGGFQRFSGSTNLRNLSGWSSQAVFPQFYCYTNGIAQQGFPIMQFITENYLFKRVQSQGRSFGPGGPDASNNDQVILKMKGMNLLQILDKMKDDAQLSDIISRKGNQFFASVGMRIKPMEIDAVIDSIVLNNQYVSIPSSIFIDKFSALSGNDMSVSIAQWMENASMPAFLFGKTEVFEVKEGDRVRYFIRLQVANNGYGDGILGIGIREQRRDRDRGGMGGGFGPMGGDGPSATVEETFNIPAGKGMEIGMFSDSEPRELIINTYVAENIPSSQRIAFDGVSNRSAAAFEGIREYAGAIRAFESYETVVDNEDAGFSTINQSESKTIKDWWMGRSNETSTDKYQGMNWWNPSSKWQPTLGANYFGLYVKSAVYKQSGTGNASVQWAADLPESGNYTVYAFLPQQRRRGPRRDEQEEKGVYRYSVFHDDGKTDVDVDLSNESGGWVYLGDFYISKGQITVTLTDQSERRMVIADAVKWVRKK